MARAPRPTRSPTRSTAGYHFQQGRNLGVRGGTFTRTYINPGSFTITQKAIGTIGQMATATPAAASA